MPDVYEKIFGELCKQLPRKQDQVLLRTILDCLRKDGVKGVSSQIDAIVDDIVEDM